MIEELTPLERAVIRAVLVDGAPGVTELRAQLELAVIAKRWRPPSPSFDVAVPAGCVLAPVPDGPFPVEGAVFDAGGDYIGMLIVWISGGRLNALEYGWVTDEMPLTLPPVSAIVTEPTYRFRS